MNYRKLFIISLVLGLALGLESKAAPIFNAPAVRIQPNGDTLHCLLSGDEFYHRLHDAEGYTIIQNPRTGYWVYADTKTENGGRRTENDKHWQVVATNYVAGTVDPASVGLSPNVGVDRETWSKLQHRYDVPAWAQRPQTKTSGRNHGTLNNIVIFIRFSDETEISTSLSSINTKFNDSSDNATSMYQYFKTVSYNKLHIITHYYPTPNGNNVLSYQDSLPRSYYMPYDSITNTNGYQDDSERRTREFDLLERAVNYINTNYPISSSLNIDFDNDNYVDNICFVVKGTYTGWSELLWPHKWSIYDRYVYINGKRVYTFNLQLEGGGEHYFSSSAFCHEMFHTLGAPDLYRYHDDHNVSGVGSWDLMCSNTTPPQTMGAYMKWKYGNWIDSVPEIRIPSTYTLHSLGDNSYDNCVYKIAAQEPHQWYVLEYRDNTERFETTLPGKGLLIYRIDDRFSGNAGFNGVDAFDEVYLFRPNASDDTTNGTVSQAYFSANTSRTSFTPTTNPHPWLTGNMIDSTIAITAIGVPGETISFTYTDLRGCTKPSALTVHNITADSVLVGWSGRSGAYRLQYRVAGTTNATTIELSSTNYVLTGLAFNTRYEWRVMGVCSASDLSDWSNWSRFQTPVCSDQQTVEIGDASHIDNTMPINTAYNYSYVQMIYTPEEVNGAKSIDRIAFHYGTTGTLNYKENCVIYMASTEQSEFTGILVNKLVPFNLLKKVYEGPINGVEGWCLINLDSVFEYNGMSNLVVAIDDNSGDSKEGEDRFYCTSTGNTFRSMTYFSNSDINPAASSMTCEKVRKKFRADIRFMGCPIEIIRHHVKVQVDPASAQYGDAWFTTESIDGCANDETLVEGTVITLHAQPYDNIPNTTCTFTGWSDGNNENPRTLTLTQDTVITAFFSGHNIGIESAFGEIQVTSRNNSVTVSGAEGRAIEVLDITGRSLYRRIGTGNDTFTLPTKGVYLLRIEGVTTKKLVY